MENVLQLELTPVQAKRIITTIKKENPERILFTKHASERMVERGITNRQIMKCIEHGYVVEGPYRDIYGNWKMTMETISAGDRISTVAVLDRDSSGNYCLIVTVF